MTNINIIAYAIKVLNKALPLLVGLFYYIKEIERTPGEVAVIVSTGEGEGREVAQSPALSPQLSPRDTQTNSSPLLDTYSFGGVSST